MDGKEWLDINLAAEIPEPLEALGEVEDLFDGGIQEIGELMIARFVLRV